MLTFISIVHIIVALLLIVTVLLQDSKGGGAFGMGGGGSNQVLSTTNAANFLVKLTRILAVTFAITCISLTYISTHGSKSVTDEFAPAAATAPAQTTPVEAPSSQAAPTTTAPATPSETPKSN